MSNFTYNAVILTAGESRRMGYPKALLDSGDGRKFLERIISNVKNTDPKPSEIILVLGYHRERILKEIDVSGCQTVTNPTPELGQLSSLITALNSMSEESRGMMVCLTDHPLVQPETYNLVVQEASLNPGSIILPRYGEKKGHPVFFPSEIFQDLKDSPIDTGARHAVRKNSHRIIVVDVDDAGILKDIDTPEQYRKEVGTGK